MSYASLAAIQPAFYRGGGFAFTVHRARRPGLLPNARLFRPVVAVTPRYSDVLGVPAVPRLTDLDKPVDLAVVQVRADRVLGVIEDGLAAGVSTFIVPGVGATDSGSRLISVANPNNDSPITTSASSVRTAWAWSTWSRVPHQYVGTVGSELRRGSVGSSLRAGRLSRRSSTPAREFRCRRRSPRGESSSRVGRSTSVLRRGSAPARADRLRSRTEVTGAADDTLAIGSGRGAPVTTSDYPQSSSTGMSSGDLVHAEPATSPRYDLSQTDSVRSAPRHAESGTPRSGGVRPNSRPPAATTCRN
ncbi:hypothetical protein EEB19_11485 [Gordonia sp. OPL2]|nr:hypothetical protein EEB19_11485 [Gordonia sp. OPL2]